MKKTYISIILIVVVCIGIGIFLYQKSLLNTQTGYGTCSQDSDCTSVRDGCCGCGSGGSDIAVNKAYAKELEKKTVAECSNIMCPAVMSKDPSCFAAPKCVNKKCALVQ